MPTSRRVAVASSHRDRLRSLRRTRVRADSSSEAGSISSSASRAVSSSTPLRRSSWASARRASPLPSAEWRWSTHVRAKALSSISPTSVNRSRRRVAISSGTRLAASLSPSSLRVRARPVSWSSRILRATASGSASGPSATGSGGVSDGGAPTQARTPVSTPPDQASVDPEVDPGARPVLSWPVTGSEGIDTDRLGRDRRPGHPRRPDAEFFEDLLLDLVGQVGVVGEEAPRVLLALAELVALVGVPGTGLADDPRLDADVDQAALAADPLAVHDVELRLLERRGHLVLDDLDPSPVADHVGAVLEGLDAAHVEPDRGVELQRPPTGRRLGRAEHDADLLPQLVDEDHGRAGVVEGTGHLAQRLAHQPGLEADVAVAHLALDLGARHQGGHRVDHDQVERA